MEVDWNWFFSAFAQSGAAIIGIIAAFVISKIIGEINIKYNVEERHKNLLIDYESLKDRISLINFEQVDEVSIRESKKIAEELGFTGLDSKKRLNLLYRIEPCLFKTEKCITVLDEVLNTTSNSKAVHHNSLLSMDEIKVIRKAVYHLKIESESIIKHFRILKNISMNYKSKLTSLKFIICVLIIGFLITVIYPLHFMPLNSNEVPSISFKLIDIYSNFVSFKGGLLSLFFITISSILVYFQYIIYKIEIYHKNNIKRINEDYINLLSYCKYFNNNAQQCI
ncbi:MAG: hypothetical protein U9R42_12860 [Bacteroidota bacterium]|nr:hypothetical protein [Bacteroidota bacterium]